MSTIPVSAGAIKRGMVLAAGLGTRMRPITDTIPKPLVPVAGRTLLDRALDHFAAAGVEQAVVNTHYFAEKVDAALAGRTAPRIVISHEPEVLETGGGVLNALAHLGDDAFLVANSDALWLDGAQNALGRLATAWDGARMDALLLLYPVAGAVGYEGRGDFFMDSEGRLERRREREIAPFLFTGVQILHPRLFAGAVPGKWSLNRVYDQALKDRKLFGMRHDGAWYHVGTPEGLLQVEAILADDGNAPEGARPDYP